MHPSKKSRIIAGTERMDFSTDSTIITVPKPETLPKTNTDSGPVAAWTLTEAGRNAAAIARRFADAAYLKGGWHVINR